VAHVCNHSIFGGRDQEDLSGRSAGSTDRRIVVQAVLEIKQYSISKTTSTKGLVE
jgi:hypothetical protein